MGRLPRTALRVVSATIILHGCASTQGSLSAGGLPDAPLPAPWDTKSCFVADTTAPTGDSIYVVGAGPPEAGPSAAAVHCDDRRLLRPTTSPTVISLTAPAGIDVRELLDAAPSSAKGHRADVLVTRDADVLAYAGRSADYFVAALPWTATYVLVPARSNSAITTPLTVDRVALARDAVTADARGAAEPFPWLTDSACAAAAPAPSADPHPVVVYPAGDATARQLAERIVSLVGANPRPPWIAEIFGERATNGTVRISALPADSIPEALATGRAAAAVLSVARDPRAHCGTRGDARVPTAAVPLVDSRAHVIVRRGSGAALVIAPDGALFFVRWGAR